MSNTEEALILIDSYYNQRVQIYNKLKNELINCKENDEQLYCETLLMFLYAQLEGYVTDLFSYYIEIINYKELKIKDVIPEISASSFCSHFDSYDDHVKSKQLSKYTGRLKFIKNLNNFYNSKINLSISLINTENNLKQKVLEDLMLKFGFEKSRYSKIGNILDNFVNFRNAIAHGNNKHSKLTIKQYETYENLVIKEIMLDLKDLIFNAIEKERYLNASLS